MELSRLGAVEEGLGFLEVRAQVTVPFQDIPGKGKNTVG